MSTEQPAPTNIVRKQGRKVQFFDGAGVTLTLTLVQDMLMTATDGVTVVEAKHRGQHLASPIVIQTEDGSVTGSMSLLLADELPTGTASADQLKPSSWIYEERAAAAGLTTIGVTPVATGGAFMIGIRIYDEADNCTKTLRPVRIEKPTETDDNSLLKIGFNFTAYMKDVTITAGDGTL